LVVSKINLEEIIEDKSPIKYTPSQGEALIKQHDKESILVELFKEMELSRKRMDLSIRDNERY